MTVIVDAAQQLSLSRPLFGLDGGEGVFRSVAFLTARDALVAAAHRCENPVVVAGPYGVGKSVLLADLARTLGAEGVKVASFSNPASATVTGGGVIIVDDADSAAPDVLRGIAAAATRHRATAIFAAVGVHIANGASTCVRLSPMSGRETQDFLVDAAVRAGRPDLFSPAALDAIAAAAYGIPRIVKLIANEAALDAALEGGVIVEARHIAGVVAARAPFPAAEEDYAVDPPLYAPPGAAQAAPSVVFVDDDDADAVPEAAPDDGEGRVVPLPMKPLPPDVEHRRFGFDARGVIIGGGALALLVATAGALAVDRLGWDRLVSMARSAITSVGPAGTGTATPEREVPAPPSPSLASGDALSQPLTDPPTFDSAAIATEELGDIGDWMVAPPPPNAATPGYRPPTRPMPTIEAARRAGIPTTEDMRQRRRAAAPANVDVTGGRAPLADGSGPALEPIGPGFSVED